MHHRGLYSYKQVCFQRHNTDESYSLLEEEAFDAKKICNNDKSKKYIRLANIDFTMKFKTGLKDEFTEETKLIDKYVR